MTDPLYLYLGQQPEMKVPPYSLEAERAVLGCMLIEKEALEMALEVLDVQNFYSDSNRRLFGVIKEMHVANRVVDFVTLGEELTKRELLAMIGGGEYLASLMNEVPTAAHVQDYCKIVREKAMLRHLIDAATKIVGESYKQDDEVGQLLDQAEAMIYNIRDRQARTGLTHMSGMLHEMVDHLEVLHQRKDAITGVPTGFKDFDKLTAGLQPGNLVILAARPGVGKTALALNVALHAALNKKLPVAIFSLEMSRQEIGLRMFSLMTGIGLFKLRTGFFEKAHWPLITRKAEELSEAPIYMDYSSSAMSVLTIRAATRRLATQLRAKGTPLALVVIDYLQLMAGAKKNPENRQNEVAEISRSLKGLALELQVPILALSQLNRSPEERGKDGRPQLSHLRDSGSIEQDADLVAFIWREAMNKKDPTEEERRRAKLIIAKQRSGPQGEIDLAFIPECARFANYEESDGSA